MQCVARSKAVTSYAGYDTVLDHTCIRRTTSSSSESGPSSMRSWSQPVSDLGASGQPESCKVDATKEQRIRAAFVSLLHPCVRVSVCCAEEDFVLIVIQDPAQAQLDTIRQH